MSANQDRDAKDAKIAKDYLEAHGFVVLREKSYRRAQERLRVAEALCRYADERRESAEQWVRGEIHPETVRLRERLTFVYGVARAHGASVDELSGDIAERNDE